MTTYTHLLATAALAGLAMPAPMQAAAADGAALHGSSSDDNVRADANTIIVTGVRGAHVRTIASSPVPIDVINARDLQATGRTGLKEILGNIIPSLEMPALAGGGTSAPVKPISIRGLSGDYVLILVNGKRRHTSALINNLSRISGGSTPVDIDLIPTNAVGRIEVLRDGAAAQYGSDAISGVINIILDDAPRGGEFSITGGQQYSKGAPLYQTDLSYGTPLGSNGGFIRAAIEAKYHDRAKSSAEPVPYIYPFVNGQPDPREATANHLVSNGYGRSNRDKIINSSYDAELPVSGTFRFYSFATLSYRDIKDARGGFVPAPTGYGGAANVVVNSVLTQIYPNGFTPYRLAEEWDFQATVGTRGKIGGWDLDLSSSYGRDHVRLGGDNTLNPTFGPTSPTRFHLGTQVEKLWVNNLDLSHDYDVGLAKPLTFSGGFEHRWEKFESEAGEPDSYANGGYANLVYPNLPPPSPGLVAFSGTSPADEASLSRTNVAGYIDVSTNITGRWFVGMAGRFEHYDDSAGNTWSGKFSTRYEIAKGLAIRGGVNNGFRAPSLAQTGFSTTQFASTIVGETLTSAISKFLPVNSPAAIALGAKPLKPEKSLNYTAGITYERGQLHLTVDAYQIRIDDRIVKTEFLGTANNGGSAISNLLLADGISGVTTAQFFINAVDTRTRGIDAVADYTLRTARLGTL
jgi:iron complex outermembrane receptor protein